MGPWLNDRLPELAMLLAGGGETFGVVIPTAV